MKKILRIISLIMLIIAIVFVVIALSVPTLGHTIYIGSYEFGAKQWRVCYAIYVIVMAFLFVSSFFVKEKPMDQTKNYIKWIRSKVGHEKIILTCAGGCVFNDAGAVLLQRRGDNHKWGFPGGMLELGETPQMTAVRELKEETGLDVEVGDLIGVFTDIDVHYPSGDVAQCIAIAYRLTVFGGTLTCDREETLELRYFSKDEKPELGSPAHEELWREIFKG